MRCELLKAFKVPDCCLPTCFDWQVTAASGAHGVKLQLIDKKERVSFLSKNGGKKEKKKKLIKLEGVWIKATVCCLLSSDQ